MLREFLGCTLPVLAPGESVPIVDVVGLVARDLFRNIVWYARVPEVPDCGVPELVGDEALKVGSLDRVLEGLLPGPRVDGAIIVPAGEEGPAFLVEDVLGPVPHFVEDLPKLGEGREGKFPRLARLGLLRGRDDPVLEINLVPLEGEDLGRNPPAGDEAEPQDWSPVYGES